MKLPNCSAALALCALLFAACESSSVTCDPTATGANACQMLQCPGTMRDCKNGVTDGCETDTAMDVDNCGACGMKCPTPANGEAACIDGICGVRTCGVRYQDCNANAADGCEIDTFRDANNCGTCGTVCGGGTNAAGVCIQGKCRLACQGAYLDCNGDATDGCEVNGASDSANCGNCGNTCTSVGATNAACASGSCISTMCTGTFQTCKAGPIDGCETDTAASVSNCGICGKQCTGLPNASPGCAASNCGIGMCNTGFGNCDSVTANGCETDTTTNVNHCNGCGKACPAPANATPGCAASTCGIGMCNSGFGNCDSTATNGCETNLTNDAANCSACGMKCAAPAHATPGCAGSKCGIGMCDVGYGDCDNSATNGCETDTTASAIHCGNCATVCPALPNAAGACAASKCGLGACTAPFADCDKVAGNGCESDTSSDNNNCGMCGKVCGAGTHCSGGVCVVCTVNEIAFNGHCYYLDGSTGTCDPGYSLAPESVLMNIAAQFAGLNYKHTVSGNCCIWTSDALENYGMNAHCNSPGPFATTEPTPGGAGCTAQMNHFSGQLTFCGSN